MSQWHAFGLTLAIEGVAGVALLYLWLGRRGASLVRGGALVLAASCLTHPLAWRANRVWLVQLPFAQRAAIIELTVVVLEAIVLHRASGEGTGGRLGWWQAFAVSLAMNGLSFGYGLWLFA